MSNHLNHFQTISTGYFENSEAKSAKLLTRKIRNDFFTSCKSGRLCTQKMPSGPDILWFFSRIGFTRRRYCLLWCLIPVLLLGGYTAYILATYKIGRHEKGLVTAAIVQRASRAFQCAGVPYGAMRLSEFLGKLYLITISEGL